MFIAYSPVCNSDRSVYLRYLDICEKVTKAFHYGSSDHLQVESCASGVGMVQGRHGCGAWIGDCRRSDGQGRIVLPDGSCGQCGQCLGKGFCSLESVDGGESQGDPVCSVSDRHERVFGPGPRGSEDTLDSEGASGEMGGLETSGDEKVRGRHYVQNRAKREKKKRMRQNWRSSDAKVDECVSDESVASVVTVDTRTAVEIEAVQTLAARRVVENKLAIARGRVQLAGFGDKAKSDALGRLAAARMEQRINEAKAKSQASFKKCDESLKSLGSSGSAGEYALKIEVRKAKESEKLLTYVQAQATMLLGGASPEMIARLDSIPKPIYTDVFEDFGDCSSDCSPEEVEEYYRKLNELNEEESARFCTQW